MAQRTLNLRPSSVIASASYDDEDKSLEISFTRGASYTLPGVPQAVVAGFEAAQSPGQFFHSQLKGRY